MTFRVFDAKWGTPTQGTSGGQVTWAADIDTGLQFDAGSHSAADFDNALAAAFQAWENVASIDFVQTANFAAADITVTMGALSGNVVGSAAISQFVLPGTDQIFDVDITLDSTEQWDPTTGPDLNFFAVAAHEIGHAIGLRHVDDTSEIMNSFLAAETLGDGDIAGAQLLYGRDAGDAPASAATGTVTGIGSGGGGGGDDGGSSGGGVLALVFGAFAALLGLFSGGSGAAVAMAALANTKPEEDEDEDGASEVSGVVDDTFGHDLVAFLDLAQAQDGYPEGTQVLMRSHVHDHGHGDGHAHGACGDPNCVACGGQGAAQHDENSFCLDPGCSLCGGHLQMVEEDGAFEDGFDADMGEETEEYSLFV